MQDLPVENMQWGNEIFCPVNTKVVGIELERINLDEQEDTFLTMITDISLICGAPGLDEQNIISSASISFGNATTQTRKYCSENTSQVVGLQLFHGPTNFNVERIDFLCRSPSNTKEIIPIRIFEEYANESDAFLFEVPSIEMKPMECLPNQFLCGLQTQVCYNGMTHAPLFVTYKFLSRRFDGFRRQLSGV